MGISFASAGWLWQLPVRQVYGISLMWHVVIILHVNVVVDWVAVLVQYMSLSTCDHNFSVIEVESSKSSDFCLNKYVIPLLRT